MNYDLLFKKCAQHEINLNWLIYGEEVIHQLYHPNEQEQLDYSPDSLDQRAIKCIKMIKSLPWSVSAKRKLMENYLSIVQEDIKGGSGSSMHNLNSE